MATPSILPLSSPSPAPVILQASATPTASVPLVHPLKLSKDAEDWLKTLSPSWFQSYDQIQHFWNSPTSQFALTLLSDTEFKAASDQIISSHQGSLFLGYEAVLIVILWIVRSWRLSKVSTILLKIWTQAWLSVVFWILALVAVPYIVWGGAYLTVVKEIFKAFLRHFFT